ncbi:amp dependent CoA ligase [Thelephora ganbajun]|uniref:Amp dependent CoA ligase n=1 Tax=Thelephora ganbajun TaxID=370292 RepID=A0ACB6ZBH4_THEGA|nr:amp dependent CoA ligase [Thelephora ganbajun]
MEALVSVIYEFRSIHGECPEIPDDLSIPQFFLDSWHPLRPTRPVGSPWVIDDESGNTLDYEQIRSRSYGLAQVLKTRWRLEEDQVAAIFSPNHTYYPIICFGVHRIGAAITAANPTFSAEELQYQLEATKAQLLFVHPAALKAGLAAAKAVGLSTDSVVLIEPAPNTEQRFVTLDEAILEGLQQPERFVDRQLKPGEAKTKIAFYNSSSGTTGKPKSVAIPHYSVIANVLQKARMNRVYDPTVPPERRRFAAGSVSLNVLPQFHIYGCIVAVFFQIFCGCSVLVIPKFNFTSFLGSIQKYRVSTLFVVPPMIVLLCKHPATKNYDLSSVRAVMVGAAPTSAELTGQLMALLPNINFFQGYGLTETATTVCMGPLDKKVGTLGSAGQLLPGIRARLLKPDGTYGGPGEQGELVIYSPSNALGYVNNEQATKETFIDGWVRTGDEAIIDANNDIFIVDRLKEIMKVRGFQVAPAELEGHLLNNLFVSDVCVVGVPDEYSGEVPFAFVVPSAEANERIKRGEEKLVKAQIAKYVADAKAPYKHLVGGIEFIDIIPKNPSGKLLRRLLRDKAKEARQRIVGEANPTKARL